VKCCILASAWREGTISGCSSINVLLLSWTLLFSFFTTDPVSRHAPYNVEYFPQHPFQARFSPKFSVTLTDKSWTGVRILLSTWKVEASALARSYLWFRLNCCKCRHRHTSYSDTESMHLAGTHSLDNSPEFSRTRFMHNTKMFELRTEFKGHTGCLYSILCLLSLVSVAIYQACLRWPALRSPSFVVLPVLISAAVRSCFSPRKRPSHIYCIPLSVLMVSLGHTTMAIQKNTKLADPTMHSPKAQAWAIHFALSFCLLSDCEFYRQYIKARKLNSNLTGIITASFHANLDTKFKMCRDAFGYSIRMPGGDFSVLETAKATIYHTLFFLVFFAACGCLNYPIKRMANPDPQGESLVHLLTGRNILFTSDDGWVALMEYLFLQRPVRLLNTILFWGGVDLIKNSLGEMEGKWECARKRSWRLRDTLICIKFLH
jgi:hypothetical protein